jgi:hypothetical protein
LLANNKQALLKTRRTLRALLLIVPHNFSAKLQRSS